MSTESQCSIRDRQSLIEAMQKGYRPKWIFFWGHTPDKDGSITKTCFSQWWSGHPFAVDGITYRTAEHYMMAGKARLFGDDEMLREILNVGHPNEVKALGRKVRNFDPERWGAACSEIVVQGNLAKFGQHSELKSLLLGTGNRIIVEASPRDRIWGIGMGAKNPNAEKPQSWRGQNLLGFALMEVRERLVGEQ